MALPIFVTGHAGSGKSLLTENFSGFLEKLDYRVAKVNLDPASPPRYNPDLDIREFVKTEEIMIKYSLGINGALLRSIEVGIKYINSLYPDGNWDFVIFDTPGQLELFIFTDFGKEMVEKSRKSGVCIFLVDSSRIENSIHYSAAVSQSAVISMMLGIPAITAFNKSDVASVRDLNYYAEKIREEGVLGEFFESLLRFVELTSIIYRPLRISAKTEDGFYELFTVINEVFCACGDLS